MTPSAGFGEYLLHRRRAWISLAFAIPFALVFLLIAAFMPPGWMLACLVAAIALFAAVGLTIRMMFDKRPVLRISAEGLYYRPFAERTAPWSDVTAITHIMSFGRTRVLGRTTWHRASSSDQLNFGIADLRGYPNHPGRALTRFMQRLGGLPPIIISLWLVDGPVDAILAEIAKHWSGEIQRFDPRTPR